MYLTETQDLSVSGLWNEYQGYEKRAGIPFYEGLPLLQTYFGPYRYGLGAWPALYGARHELFQGYGRIAPMERDQYVGLWLSRCFKSTHSPYQSMSDMITTLCQLGSSFIMIREILPTLKSTHCLQTYRTHNVSAKWRQYNKIRHYMRQAGVV